MLKRTLLREFDGTPTDESVMRLLSEALDGHDDRQGVLDWCVALLEIRDEYFDYLAGHPTVAESDGAADAGRNNPA